MEGPFCELHSFSIERLIRIGFEHGLITNYRMDPHTVRLDLTQEVVERDPEEARQFLIALLTTYFASGRPSCPPEKP